MDPLLQNGCCAKERLQVALSPRNARLLLSLVVRLSLPLLSAKERSVRERMEALEGDFFEDMGVKIRRVGHKMLETQSTPTTLRSGIVCPAVRSLTPMSSKTTPRQTSMRSAGSARLDRSQDRPLAAPRSSIAFPPAARY